MAGAGSRFSAAGYLLPKWAIEVRGKTLLEWSLSSLPIERAEKIVFVMLREHDSDGAASRLIRKALGADHNQKMVVVYLDAVTRGQAETVLMAQDVLDSRMGLLIFNIDTYSRFKSLASDLQNESYDGLLGAFSGCSPRFSYARLDADGLVVETAEKQVISEYALIGMYYFRQAGDFFWVAQNRIGSGVTDEGEYYIAPMYNDLIKEGKKIALGIADENWILGTPEELAAFEAGYEAQ
jgi:dTDP-glucose pyrophosphorylase